MSKAAYNNALPKVGAGHCNFGYNLLSALVFGWIVLNNLSIDFIIIFLSALPPGRQILKPQPSAMQNVSGNFDKTLWKVTTNESHKIKTMLKVVLILLFLIQTLTFSKVFGQTNAANRIQSPIMYALFTSQTEVDFAFYRKNYKPVKLTTDQLVVVQSIIKRVSDSLKFLITSTDVNTGIIDTLKHAFQIVSAINKKGQVNMWVNAICDLDKDWRGRLIFVDGGGSCYYTFRINLKTKQYSSIEINASE